MNRVQPLIFTSAAGIKAYRQLQAIMAAHGIRAATTDDVRAAVIESRLACENHALARALGIPTPKANP